MSENRAGGNAWDAFIEDPRNGREMTSRAQQSREEITYLETENIPSPEPRPGLVHRWVRGEMASGGTDARNFNQRIQEGWSPVQLKDYPEMRPLMEAQTGTPELEGYVTVEGLTLCVMPEARAAARDRHYQKKNEDILRSVDSQFMRQTPNYEHIGVERTNESSSKQTFGRGIYQE